MNDSIFKALADPARRTLLDRLRTQDGQTLQELQGQFDMTRFGVMKHLGVLEDAGLVTTKKVGRFKHHYLNAVPLQQAMDRWIEPLLARPAARGMIDLKSSLEGTKAMSKPDFMMSTYIKCTQDALWDAMTDPDQAIKYNFAAAACEKRDNALVYSMEDGSLMLVCTHTEETPKTRIDSTFEPHWAGPDVPLQASRFVYLIDPQDGYCKLTLEHYDLPEDMSEGVSDGWVRTLAALKSYLETGEPTVFIDPDLEG